MGGLALKVRIHNIGGYSVNNYLLETEKGIIAIDTGYPGGMGKFMKRFEKRWPLSQLKYIFLTHHHDDHAGFLGDLLEVAGAKVILHSLAVQALELGRNNEPPGVGYPTVLASVLGKLKRDSSFPPVEVDARAIMIQGDDEQVFENMGLPLRILLLPGHTADSIGLFLPESGRLFCGDAAMNAVISLARHAVWIENVVEFGRSWDRMLALNPTRIYPSHGSPFSPRDLLRYRHFMEGRKLIQRNP